MDETDIHLVIQRLTENEPLAAADVLGKAPSSVWIASGLAKISAFYGVSLLQRLTGAPCRFVTPLEYGQNPRIRCMPVLSSLRGNHPDALEVAEEIVARRGEGSILVSADPSGESADLLRSHPGFSLATDSLPDRDKRYVNLKSVLMMSALSHRLVAQACGSPDESRLLPAELTAAWMRSLHTGMNVACQLESIPGWQEKQLYILHSGLTSELSLAWQSILSEAGIISPAIIDIKDFTHGDHLATTRIGNGIFLVISTPETHVVSETFRSRFSTLYPVIDCRIEAPTGYRFWENLFTVATATSALTAALGYPNQRPPKNPIVWSWRGWGSIKPDWVIHG